MQKKPKVAIITRTLDRPIFLERALKSIHCQTMKDFIHVIYNDNGDPELVEDLLVKHKDLVGNRVIVIHNKKSEGIEAASNKAIKSIDSDYIAIHDDDDTWHQDFLKKTIELLDKAGKCTGGVVVKTNKIIEELTENSINIKKTIPWMPDLKVISLYRQCIENQMTPITFVFRRSSYTAVGDFDETLELCGDWDFGIRFLQKYDVEFIDPGYALANYHHRKYKAGAQGNTSYSNNDKHRYYSNKLANKYLRQELSEGRLGVGYIISFHKYKDSMLIASVKKLLPNRVINQIKKKL